MTKKLNKMQRDRLARVCIYLLELALVELASETDKKEGPTDESLATESVGADNKNLNSTKNNNRNMPAGQGYPPLHIQAKEKLERAKANNDYIGMAQHSLIAEETEGLEDV